MSDIDEGSGPEERVSRRILAKDLDGESTPPGDTGHGLGGGELRERLLKMGGVRKAETVEKPLRVMRIVAVRADPAVAAAPEAGEGRPYVWSGTVDREQPIASIGEGDPGRIGRRADARCLYERGDARPGEGAGGEP